MHLDHKAGVNAGDSLGATALMAVALTGHSRIARTLLEHNADIHAVTDMGDTAVSFNGNYMKDTPRYSRC